MTTDLTEYASEQQRRFDLSTSPDERKQQGHFGTPPAIAHFMAGQFSWISGKMRLFPGIHAPERRMRKMGQAPSIHASEPVPFSAPEPVPFSAPEQSGIVRVLDPGAGVGTLSAAVCQRVLAETTRHRLFFELWENDPRLEPYLRRTMEHCRKVLRQAGHDLEYTIRREDFVLANSQKSLFDDGPSAAFHWAILNPPYFKLRKESAHARAMEHLVYGQPNIYAFFMAVAVDLLLPGGEIVAITPRSYFNGPYFKRFRKWFFQRVAARQIHVFESRTEAFRDDAVLQENVILRAEKAGTSRDVILTTSMGRDLADVQSVSVPYDQVVDNSHGDFVVRVTTNEFERAIIETMERLPSRFHQLGFDISTGPVVTFRSTEFLRDERAEDTAPLLWMHNVRPFVTRFPPNNGKPTHIAVSTASKKLLVPARRYVLLKRFTAKEEKRRLVAGVVDSTDSYSEWIGLENHLNYVFRKEPQLSSEEAFGLAAFFNSALVDRYFRTISGNTQVNATEIRTMPVPDLPTLVKIGRMVHQQTSREYPEIERIVGKALKLPKCLIDQLCEVAK
jgi:adenine-specific DNA-methyltransferase